MVEIGRLITAMVTPMDSEGKVDYEQAKRLANALLDSGSDAVIVSGTTGESPTLTTEEKLRLFGEVKDAVGDRGRGHRRHGQLQHRREHRAQPGGRKGRRGRPAAGGALLQTSRRRRGCTNHFKAISESTKLPAHPVQRNQPHQPEHVPRDNHQAQ